MRWPIPAWFRRVLDSPAEELTRWQRTVRFSVDLGRHCAGELRHDKAGQMAAALTYHTLFSMLPTIVLILVALKAFVGPQQRQEFKDQVVTWVLTSLQGGDKEANTSEDNTDTDKNKAPQAVDKADAAQALANEKQHEAKVSPNPPEPGAEPETPKQFGTERKQEFHAVQQRLDETFRSAIDYLEKINFGSIGIVGVLVFIYSATGLLSTIEKSFNSIFGVAYGRSLYVRFPLYFTTLILGPLLLLAGQYIQSQFTSLLQHTGGELTAWLSGIVIVLAPLITMWLVLYLIYLLMPNTSVSKQGAAIGSFVASLGLLAISEGFRWYVNHAAIANLYGALALLPLFLMFVWLVWLIVLFGLELTYTLGAMKGRRRFKRLTEQPQDQIVDPAWMVPLASMIADAFVNGKTMSVDEMSRLIHLPPRTLRRMLSSLENNGIVHVVGARDSEERFSLARPADHIRLADVIEASTAALPPINSPEGPHAAWSMVHRLREAELDFARRKTLADLVAEQQAEGDNPSPAPA